MQPLCQSIQSRMKRFEEETTSSSTVEFKSKRRGRPVCWIVILAVATFVFLVLSIVFITLFALEKSKSTETSPTSPVSGQKYCGTRACLETSLGELIKSNLLVFYSEHSAKQRNPFHSRKSYITPNRFSKYRIAPLSCLLKIV